MNLLFVAIAALTGFAGMNVYKYTGSIEAGLAVFSSLAAIFCIFAWHAGVMINLKQITDKGRRPGGNDGNWLK